MRGGLSARPPRGADAVRARAFFHLDARLSRDAAAPLALALSGGGDSLALLRLAAEWCAAARRPLLALTVDHGLSPASADWSAFARARARALGAEWRGLAWEGDKPGRSLAAAARQARHALLAQAAREAGACVVLLGHTADDGVEGERMRATGAPTLGRLRAWTPSPVWPEGRGVALLRPLLEVSRAELRAWLAAEGETGWVEDPANADPRSPRVCARRAGGGVAFVAPEPPPGLAALARSVRADPGGALAWCAPHLREAGDATAARALAIAAVCVGGGARLPGAAAVAALADVVYDRTVRTLAGARIAAAQDEVGLTRAPPSRPPADVVPLDVAHAWDGRFLLVPLRPGWRLAPIAGHAARLPAEERRALARVPAVARPMLPVLLALDGAPRLPGPFGGGPARADDLVAGRFRLAAGAVRTEAELAREAACAGDLDAYPPFPPPCR